MCWQTARSFASSLRVPAEGRAFVALVLSDLLGPPAREIREDAELVASELLTNCVNAGAQDLSLRLEVHHDSVRVQVCGDGSGAPVLGSPGNADTSGRGLVIVGALADNWGVTKQDQLTCVWAVIGATADMTVELECLERV